MFLSSTRNLYLAKTTNKNSVISLSDTHRKHFAVTELPKTHILLFVYCFNDQNHNKQTVQLF